MLYPGVLCFYKELDLGAHPKASKGSDGYGSWPKNQTGNLAFLSARPHLYKDISEMHSYHRFEKLCRDGGGMHSMPTLLSGDFNSGQAFMLQGNLEPMAKRKVKNFTEYYSLYPEFKHVFVCDNGQADVRAAELIKRQLGMEALEVVFVHKVLPLSQTFGAHPSGASSPVGSSSKVAPGRIDADADNDGLSDAGEVTEGEGEGDDEMSTSERSAGGGISPERSQCSPSFESTV